MKSLAVFDRLFVPPFVALLFFVGAVMVIVVGLGSGADTDASYSNQNLSNAETLSKRHGREFD